MRTHRRGITLVELLVVMSILAALASIVAVFAPRMMDHARVPDAARQLQTWLQMSRQRAVRDQAPRGIRLLPGGPVPTQPNDASNIPTQSFYSKFIYIEQPEDITVSPAEIAAVDRVPFQTAAKAALDAQYTLAMAKTPPDTISAQIYQTYSQALDPSKPVNQSNWQLLMWLPGRNLQGTFQRGDVIEFASARYYLVTDAVQVKTGDCILVLHRARDDVRNPSVLTPAPGVLTQLPAGRITRSAQPIAGEPELDLQQDIAIDVLVTSTTQPETRSLPAPVAGGTGSFDIMFSSSGEMTGNLATSGTIILWVRDTSLGEPESGVRGGLPPGDNRLIVIHSRTGMVTAHPVFTDLNSSGALSDAYKFVRDGKSSALE